MQHAVDVHSVHSAPTTAHQPAEPAVQNEVVVAQASPGAAASAPAEGLSPGLSVSVTVTPSNSSAAAAPLVVEASPSPATRRLLTDVVTGNGTGVNVNVTVTAPASDIDDVTSLVQQALSSGALQQELQKAGEYQYCINVVIDITFSLICELHIVDQC